MILIAGILAAATMHAGPRVGAPAVLAKMAAVNASVRTYKVRIHFDAKVRAFLSLPLSLDATLYYKQPDKMQIVFDTVPSLAKQFQDFYANTGTPQTWPRTYIITLEPPGAGDAPSSVTLRLTPKSSGNLEYALMTVDTTNWGIIIQQWIYKDGSNISVAQFNETGDHYVLPGRQLGDFAFPRYKAHVDAEYGPYDINVPISDSIFTTHPQQQ